MWLVLAGISAILTGSIAVVVKYGFSKLSRECALFIRNATVLCICVFILIFGFESQPEGKVTLMSVLALLISGIMLSASWLTYYRALELGKVSTVSVLERLSIPLTVLGGALFLHEGLGLFRVVSLVIICIGIFISVDSTVENKQKGRGAVFYGICSAFFGSVSVLFSKVGIERLGSVPSLAVRTAVVFIITLILAKKHGGFEQKRRIPKKELFFAIGTGIAAGAAWICCFRALQLSDAGLVQPIDKLGVVVSIMLSRLLFKESIGARQYLGIAVMCIGIIMPIFMR